MEAALSESTWQSVRERLESDRRRINDEIEHYPPPIPRCDAQFNYLLEARANIARVTMSGTVRNAATNGTENSSVKSKARRCDAIAPS